MTDSPRFHPKPLPKASVEAPLEPRWKIMGDEEARRLHAVAQAEHRRWARFGPVSRKRLLVSVIGSSIGFAVLGWLFVSGNTRALVYFGVAGAFLGVINAIVRPAEFLTGLFYALAAFVAVLKMGGHVIQAGLAAFCLGSIGIAVGTTESLKRIDGE